MAKKKKAKQVVKRKKKTKKRKKKAPKKKVVKKKKKKPAKKRPLSKKTLKGGKKRRGPKKGKRGKRYSAKRQTSLLDKYHELRKGGMSAEKAAKKVGVSYLTLLKWEKKTGKRIKSKRGRPLSKKTVIKKALKTPKKRGRKAKAAKKVEGHTLVTPTGFRIEGISTGELIRVLKALK